MTTRGYAGGPGRPSSWITAKASSSPPTAIRPNARLADPEVAADPDQEQHGREEHGVADVLVRRRARLGALGERGVGLRIVGLGGGLLGNDVLRHVRRPGRSVGIVRRVRRQPGVERRAVTRAHPPCRQPLRVGVSGREGGEPGVERGGVERAGHDPLECRRGWPWCARADALASVTEDSVLHFAAA